MILFNVAELILILSYLEIIGFIESDRLAFEKYDYPLLIEQFFYKTLLYVN